MSYKFNPFNYQLLFSEPKRLTAYSHWHEHIPFGMWAVGVLKPQVLVELGTYHGDSYCAFCQVIAELELESKCYLVDIWKDNIKVSRYTSELFEDLRKHHDHRYGHFSEIMACKLEEALLRFQPGTIDLLHIDTGYSYDSIKHDFENWLPKMSRRGVVLIHKTNAQDNDYGMKRYFDKIKLSFKHFEFLHGHGLGMVLVGDRVCEELEWLAHAESCEADRIRKYFYQQGRGLSLDVQADRLVIEAESIRSEALKVEHQEREVARLNQSLVEYESQVRVLQGNLNLITGSKGWALLQTLWGIKRRIMPKIEPTASTQTAILANPTVPVKENGNPPQSRPVRAQTRSLILSPHNNYTLTINDNASNGLRPQPGLVQQSNSGLRLIAFYLPQFYPIPENDLWWGKGFTEWTNVSKAKPNFEGHYQPHLPADLGFYDLRVSETREQQARLAREYGIHGFCYYHYWFGGRKLLNRPIEEVLSTGKPDFPFCLCWANQNWTRRWDGLDSEILIAQSHSDEDDRRFIRSLFTAFEDERYIRVNGKPLLLVYRIDLLPGGARAAEIWREECYRAGIGEIYLCTAHVIGMEDPKPYGFDAAVEFPPNGGLVVDQINNKVRITNPHFQGTILDYLQTANFCINKPETDYVFFRTVMPSWDNTARRQNHGLTFLNSSPDAYQYWLRNAIELTIERNSGDERMVFINAWNEWAEGAHLEPDREYGHRFLEATRNSLRVDRHAPLLLSHKR